MKCKLCNRNEANQTGSHITSAFLLSSQIGKRGEERGFLITTDPSHDYSQNQKDNGLKEDFIFCRDCEKRLGIIENIYATEITQKIEDKKFERNFQKTEIQNGHYKLNCERISPIAFQLLIQSNIWRASISEQPLYNHFKLSKVLEEKLRFNLDLFLPDIVDHKLAQSEGEWLKMIRNYKELFYSLPIAIIKAENIEDKETTFEFFDSVSVKPFHIILNEYVIYVFDESLNWNDDFFELKKEFVLNDIINSNSESAIITIIPNKRYFEIIKKIRDLAVQERIQKIEKQCLKELFTHGIPITPETLKQMVVQKVNEIKME